MAVVSDRPVGCDVEEIRSSDNVDNAMIADYCFAEKERRMILSAPDPAVEFTRIWTAKEALFKLDNSLEIECIDTTSFPEEQTISKKHGHFIATLAASDQDLRHHKIRLSPIR